MSASIRPRRTSLLAAVSLCAWLPAPGALAQDATIDSTLPSLFFDDTEDDACLAGWDWRIQAEGGESDQSTFNAFTVHHRGETCGSNTVVPLLRLEYEPGVSNSFGAITARADGDIILGGNLFRLDRSSGRLSLGTSNRTPFADLQINDATPDIRLFDESVNSFAEWQLDGNLTQFLALGASAIEPFQWLRFDAASESAKFFSEMVFERAVSIGDDAAPGADLHIWDSAADIRLNDTDDGSEAELEVNTGAFRLWTRPAEGSYRAPIKVELTAPSNSLAIDAQGDVGIGTTSPDSKLTVARPVDAQILVWNTAGAPAPRDLFLIRNAGNTKFQIEETITGNNWAFTNSGNDFRVSLQGSGVVELRVDNNGDAFLASGTLTQNSDVNAKQNIVPVNLAAILERVVSLPISRWEYRDTPGVVHLGPMAQDFHAAFGLGATDMGISSIDTGGVALAAIQALESRNHALREALARMKSEQRRIERRLAEVEARLTDSRP